MRTINGLSRRTAALETNIQTAGQVVTIEETRGGEILRWGKLIVKMIRGVSFSDL
jgi:hypothetical protein